MSATYAVALPEATRRRVGVLLPRIMLAYLALDEAALAAVLADCGIADPTTVAGAVAAAPQTVADIRKAAAPSLRMFAHSGMFADPRIADAFAAYGLPVEPGT